MMYYKHQVVTSLWCHYFEPEISTRGKKRVNIKFVVESLVVTETYLNAKFHVQCYYKFWVTWVQGDEEEGHGQTATNSFSCNLDRMCWFHKILFNDHFSFHMFCTLKLKVRTEFPNVWVEYHSNPYIHSTTVLCDIEKSAHCHGSPLANYHLH